MVTRRESLIREGILNPDGSRKGDRDRFPKLIAEGILPGGGFGISPPANTQLGQPRPVLQPPMTSVSGGVNSFPNAFDPGSQLGNGTIRTGINPGGQFVQPGFGGARGIRTADFRDSNNDGIDDRNQGFQNLPGANQGINLPINIGNNPSFNPIQDQMFRPPMQQPVQNQMPVANSFLEQLQQSAGLLQNQVTALQPPVVNNVPQNRFVGNQFQMPFGMGQPTPFGGNYGSGGFNLPYNPGSYTPGAFNQYGDTSTTGGINNIISSLLGPGADRGGEGAAGGYVDNRSLSDQVNDVYGPNAVIKQLGLGLIPGGGPLGYLNNAYTRYKLDKQYGIGDKIEGSQYSEVYNDAIANGATPSEATQRATIMGGGTYTDATFDNANLTDMSINDQLRALEKQLYGTNVTTPTEQETTFGDFIGGLLGLGDRDNTGPTGPGIGDIDSEADINRESFRGRTTGGGEGGGGGGSSCFVKGTMLQMADGTKKEISTVKLGDNTKGGIVEMTMQGLPQTIYNYKDVLVSGSHWVIEDNEFVAVEDSKHGVLTDKVEPVYTLKTSDHRMWINNIEFGDFETGSDNDWEPHFEMVRKKLNKELRDGK